MCRFKIPKCVFPILYVVSVNEVQTNAKSRNNKLNIGIRSLKTATLLSSECSKEERFRCIYTPGCQRLNIRDTMKTIPAGIARGRIYSTFLRGHARVARVFAVVGHRDQVRTIPYIPWWSSTTWSTVRNGSKSVWFSVKTLKQC